MPEEGKDLLKRIEANCKLLYDGYSESVEYRVAVAYHRDGCQYYAKSRTPKDDCECPVVNEGRAKRIARPSLLEQLQAFAVNRDTDRNPKSERGAPRVKTPKCHAELAGFFTYDEIVSDIYAVVDRAMEEAERDRLWATSPVAHILAHLHNQVAVFVEARPDVARTLDRAARGWVEKARSALMITVGDSVFQSVTCGNCGGGLSTPWGNRGEADVRCVGTPAEPPCGHTYPMSEWITLYEDHKRRAAA
jgi:hypothetical protein